MATPKPPSNTNQKPTGISLAERQKEAAKKLENQTIVVKEQVQTPVKLPEPTIITKVKSEESIPKKDRREELNRKTEEARKKLQEITTQTSDNLASEEIEEQTFDELDDTAIDDSSIDNVITNATKDTISKDVFKKVSRTKKSPISGDKRKRKRRGEKKGGGRQKMEKKLNRQRILEFKYFAREELDNPNIPEEHRSNILGQIIAKGERTSIDSAIDFIQLKQAELILTEDVANSLINEIKRISTRR